MQRIILFLDDWVVDMLKDESTQMIVFGQAYAYMKKHNKITMSATIRKIVETYLRDRGLIE